MQPISLTVEPLSDGDADSLFLVLFADLGPPLTVEEAARSRALVEGDRAAAQLESDLRHTRERLQSMMEEYETALEELKAANEELVSMNEELQSTNEELETSKEEIQSVNEELHTVNAGAERQGRPAEPCQCRPEQPVRQHPDRGCFPRPQSRDPQLHACGHRSVQPDTE